LPWAIQPAENAVVLSVDEPRWRKTLLIVAGKLTLQIVTSVG